MWTESRSVVTVSKCTDNAGAQPGISKGRSRMVVSQATVGVILIISSELDVRGFGKWRQKAVTN